MKKTKYLVLSAAAVLAVGCNGGKMPQIADSDAVTIAKAIQKKHEDILADEGKDIPTKVTITKTYHETHESNLFYEGGKVAWVDDETYKIEIDLDAGRVSIELDDTDTATDDDTTGVHRHEKIDYVYKNSALYYYLNFNDIGHVYDTIPAAGDSLEDSQDWLLMNVLYNPKEIYRADTATTITTSVINIPYAPSLTGWSQTHITGPWNYLTGEYDIDMDFVFHDIVYRGDVPTFFPGYLNMVTDETNNIHKSTKAVADLIEKKSGGYRDGSYAKYFYGGSANDNGLYVETNYKLGYTVEELPTAYIGYVLANAVKCDYKTDMSFTYSNGYMSDTSLDHTQELIFTNDGKETGEYMKRSVTQKVTVKLESKIGSETFDSTGYTLDETLV